MISPIIGSNRLIVRNKDDISNEDYPITRKILNAL